MGWGTCGRNPVTGDMMGYCYLGVCAADECTAEIDHGLSYVCGGMHEGDGIGCGRYFCEKHLTCIENGIGYPHPELTQVCLSCEEEWEQVEANVDSAE